MQVCWLGSAPIKSLKMVLIVVPISTILSTDESMHVCTCCIICFLSKMLSTHSLVPLSNCHKQYVGGIRKKKKAHLYECSSLVCYMVNKHMHIERHVFIRTVLSPCVTHECTMPLSTIVIAKQKQRASDQLITTYVLLAKHQHLSALERYSYSTYTSKESTI